MPPRLRPSALPSTSNVIPHSFSSSPLLPFLLPSHHIYTAILAPRSSKSSPSSSRNFSTSKPAYARGRRFEKTEGKRNGFIEWMEKMAPRLNVPNPHPNVPVYMRYEPQALPKNPADKSASASGLSRKKKKLESIDWERAKENAQWSPFPSNPTFKAHPVISAEFREQIYLRIKSGRSVRRVSAELNCELERVAAVVRLKEIEKKWVEQNRPLCTEMQIRVHAMMPVTNYELFPQHESITDLRIHPATNNQLFLPVPESMPFNRKDAGDALGILPADVRMPHSELIEVERMKMAGMEVQEMVRIESERELKEAEEMNERRARIQQRKNAGRVVETERFRFRLKPATTGSVGHRYGVPAEDRKKGINKIPTKVL